MKLSGALASVLRSGREDFNARFAEARHAYPNLEGTVFSDFLLSTVDPLVQAVERVRSDCVAEVVNAAYDVALELIGQKLAGSGDRQAIVDEGWRRIFNPAASLLASSPRSILAAVSNALLNLAATPGARPTQWIDLLEKLAPRCADAEMLLRLGQVAGWRAGLAQYRASALATAATLPESIALEVLDAPPSAKWPELLAALAHNPWLDPAQPSNAAGLRLVAQAGAFRGFGGLFAEPPRVAAAGDHFCVRSGDGYWLLAADAFGATFHRASPDEFKSGASPANLLIDKGRIRWNGQTCDLPALGEITSAAANATSLALTSKLSHAIALVALTN